MIRAVRTTHAADLDLILSPPVIASVDPPAAGPGATVSVMGDHFGASTGDPISVTFNGTSKYAQDLQGQVAKIVQIVKKRYPNVKLAYLSSRSWGGWAKVPDDAPPGRRESLSSRL